MVLLASGTSFCLMSIKLGYPEKFLTWQSDEKGRGTFWDLFWSPFTHHPFSSALLGKSSSTPAKWLQSNQIHSSLPVCLHLLLNVGLKRLTPWSLAFTWASCLPHTGNSKLFLGKYELHLNLKQASECLALGKAHHRASRSLMSQ